MTALPRDLAVRLRDARSHFHALVIALSRVTLEEYARAVRERDPELLAGSAYPIERPFEILDNYTIELGRRGLELAGLDGTGPAPAILARLHAHGVIGAARRDTLRRIHEHRNDLQHEYPDVTGPLVYEAAVEQLETLPAFFRDFAAWLRRLGFGEQA